MFNKKLLAASMAAAISTGMAVQVHAIQMQENDIGQVLMAPTYMTSGDLRTDVTIVNTRTDAAVKAKIVFRNGIDSAEVLDFVLYLTPGDVWRGSVTGEANAAFMDSTDDSMTDDGGNFASADNPVHQEFFDKTNSGQNGIGHFEVYGLYSVEVGEYTPVGGTAVTVQPTMTKPDLKAIFDSITSEGGPGLDTVPGAMLSNSNKPMKLQIMGETQLVNGANGLISYNIPALGPTDYTQACTTVVPYTNCVVENTNFDATVGSPTDMGVAMGWDGALADDNIIAIETAIAAKDFSFPYTSDAASVSIPVVSFVTKYRHLSDVCGSGVTVESGAYYPPFEPTTIGEVIISITSYDNKENSAVITSSEFSGDDTVADILSLPIEVNFMTNINYFSLDGSTSGWANIGFYGVEPGCPYIGAPAVSSVLKNEGGGFYWNATGDRRQAM
ncbi:MAG: hypothetical protein KZQ83_07990 [gamma proteobacterium symbiont of Taylorina sp.]|nr:hypothetical protein [gamma proteobacterium symbiont of Taylorina sp.]